MNQIIYSNSRYFNTIFKFKYRNLKPLQKWIKICKVAENINNKISITTDSLSSKIDTLENKYTIRGILIQYFNKQNQFILKKQVFNFIRNNFEVQQNFNMKQQYPVPKVTKKVIIINQKSNAIHENDNRCNTQNQQQTNSDQKKQNKKIEIPIELEQSANNYNEQSYQQKTLLYQQNSIQLQDFQAQIDELKERIQFFEQKFTNLEASNKKKKKRRTAAEIEKNFECPYKNCLKQYGSDVSLNLHIKFKHNGGNKSERQKIIVNTILQQKKQVQAGEIDEKDIRNINLPPI